MEFTTNLNLKKPGYSDLADIRDLNENFDKIDNSFKELEDEVITLSENLDEKVADLVDSAPEKLDTLQELANALNNDENFANTVIGMIDQKADEEHSHTVGDVLDFPTAMPANGGNADTVDGKHAKDFAANDHNHDNEYLKLSGGTVTGSFNIEIDGTKTTIDCDGITTDGSMNVLDIEATTVSANKFSGDGADVTNVNAKTLNGKNDTYFAESGHTHTKEEITDFPTSLPANGGNADTVGGKSPEDFATSDHNHDDEYLKLTGGALTGDLSVNNNIKVANNFTSSKSNVQLVNWQYTGDYAVHALISNNTEDKTTKYLLKHSTNSDVITSDCNISAPKFIGDGSELTNVNATSLAGLGVNNIQKITSNYYVPPKNADGVPDWNYLTTSGYYGLVKSGYLNAPNSNNGFFPFIIAYSGVNGAGSLTQIAFAFDGTETYIRRCIYDKWTAWTVLGEGCNAQTVGKVNKTFTVKKGSWYRLATNNLDACGGVFILSVGSGSCSSTTVFSASQQYSIDEDNEKKISVLSHSNFNKCVAKLRLVNKYGSENEQYIDFYVENGTDGATGNLEVQFFGKGWNILSSINSANIIDGYTVTEIEL